MLKYFFFDKKFAMRLKQLKMAGFKSFANPTTFHFKHTITAIVGPNGCGKSNVIDAVRWVLGESSAKQLRGGAMNDVIFAGSQDKAGKSLASVELVFENTQADQHGHGGIHHPLNLYHELSVRRQITKDGKSDYFINGTKVRRRDVVDIFLGTGLGARSYAVIEQGMIGRIIDANAQQLREFIEEASGVSRYQSRKGETQKQLQTANDNLNRLNDMNIELSNQQQRLEKQAKTAQKAQEYQQKIEHINKQLFHHEYLSLNKEKNELKQTYQQQQQHLQNLQQQQQNLQQTQKNLITQSHEQKILQQEQQNHYQRQWQIKQESQLLFNQQQNTLTEYQTKINLLHQEQQQLTEQIQQTQTTLDSHKATAENLPNKLENIKNQLEKSKQENSLLQAQRQTQANQINQLHKHKQECEKQLAVCKNNLKINQQQINKIVQQQQNHAQKVAQLAKQQEMLAEDDNELLLNELTEKYQRLENHIIERQVLLEEQNELVDSLKTQLSQYQQQQQTWQTEQNTLYDLLNKQNQFLQKIKQKQQSNQNFPLFIENLQLSEQGKQFSKIFDELFSIFSKWTSHDRQNFAQLTGHFASFFAKNTHTYANNLSQEWINLQTLVDKPILPILQNVYINRQPINLAEVVDILENIDNIYLLVQTDKQELWLFSAFFCINLNQLHQSDNTVDIGQRFSHQLRIDDLQDLLEKQAIPLQKLNKRLQEACVSLQEWQAQDKNQRQELKQLSDKIQQLKQQKISLVHQKNQWQKDKIRLDEEALLLEKDKEAIQKCLKDEQQKLDAITENLAKIDPSLSKNIQQREQFDQKIAEILISQKQQENSVSELSIALTKAQLQYQHEQDILTKLYNQSKQNVTQVAQLQDLLTSLAENLPNLAEQLAIIQEKLSKSEENLHDTNEKITELEQQKSQIQQKIETLQHTYQAEQQVCYTLETKLALCEQKIEQLLEKTSGYGTDITSSDSSMLLTVQALSTLQTEKNQLEQNLEKLGAVNYSAIAELSEVNERLLPLQTQINDLIASIDTLRQAISEIDEQTKQLFTSMLNQVNFDLNQLFNQVFGGGQAQLVLSDNNWQSGLELMAQPKGKKNSRLALLSGGEKTLTALSLVFAIFKQQPAPFCVLDEVDAPLDDANVARFTNLIKDLAKNVQFIFISHNKLAMQVADELKGITMPTAGVSTLVSVDMKDISQYLD